MSFFLLFGVIRFHEDGDVRGLIEEPDVRWAFGRRMKQIPFFVEGGFNIG
jgi:hypothetical protein